MGHLFFVLGEERETQLQIPFDFDRSLRRTISAQDDIAKMCPCYPRSQNRDLGHPFFVLDKDR
jgi:hypothetical protein